MAWRSAGSPSPRVRWHRDRTANAARGPAGGYSAAADRGFLSAAPGAGGASAGNRLTHWLQRSRDTPTQRQSLRPQWLLPGGRNEKDTMRCPASQWPRSLLLYLLNERVFCV